MISLVFHWFYKVFRSFIFFCPRLVTFVLLRLIAPHLVESQFSIEFIRFSASSAFSETAYCVPRKNVGLCFVFPMVSKGPYAEYAASAPGHKREFTVFHWCYKAFRIICLFRFAESLIFHWVYKVFRIFRSRCRDSPTKNSVQRLTCECVLAGLENIVY